MKISVVTPIPTPYRDPFWRVLAGHEEVDLRVYYCAGGKADRPWTDRAPKGFRSEVLPGWNLLSPKGPDASMFLNPGVGRSLKADRPDVLLVGGYNHPTMWLAMKTARKTGVPFFLMCETWRGETEGGLKMRIKDRAMHWIASHAAGMLPTGMLASRYLLGYGANPDTMIPLPNVPDIRAIGVTMGKIEPERDRMRCERGLGAEPVILFVGRLLKKKRPRLLVEAFAKAAATCSGQLVIVGDGPERMELETMVENSGLSGRVRFTGFLQPEDVVTWYALSDLFVLPSSETWGVAVIEALAAGLPVIVSDEVGCHPDVVTNKIVGSAVRAGDARELEEVLQNRMRSLQSRSMVNDTWKDVRKEFDYSFLARRMLEGFNNLLGI